MKEQNNELKFFVYSSDYDLLKPELQKYFVKSKCYLQTYSSNNLQIRKIYFEYDENYNIIPLYNKAKIIPFNYSNKEYIKMLNQFPFVMPDSTTGEFWHLAGYTLDENVYCTNLNGFGALAISGLEFYKQGIAIDFEDYSQQCHIRFYNLEEEF